MAAMGRATQLAEKGLAALAVTPPGFVLSELSTPMLRLRAPTYGELYSAYRYRRPLTAVGLASGLALLAQRRAAGSLGKLAGTTWGTLGAMAALRPLVYDPFLFKPRRSDVRLRRGDEAGPVFAEDDTEVLGLRLGGEARAYPVRHAARPHFIADELGGERVVVTYCGLTNSAIAYRAAEDELIDLAVVSAPSNNILYWDAATRSLVQQLLPAFAYGPAAGTPLPALPVVYTTWDAWRRLVPDSTLAVPEYDSLRDRFTTTMMRRIHRHTRLSGRPFVAVRGGADCTLHPKARVLALREVGQARAYTRGFLARHCVVNDEVGGRPVAIFYEPESDIAMAYRAELDGRRLRFRYEGEGELLDEETGTRWDVLGRATAGELAGAALDPVPFSFDKVFWFGWKRFHPDTTLRALAGDAGEPQAPEVGKVEALAGYGTA